MGSVKNMIIVSIQMEHMLLNVMGIKESDLKEEKISKK
jgi:hypothetical protein